MVSLGFFVLSKANRSRPDSHCDRSCGKQAPRALRAVPCGSALRHRCAEPRRKAISNSNQHLPQHVTFLHALRGLQDGPARGRRTGLAAPGRYEAPGQAPYKVGRRCGWQQRGNAAGPPLFRSQRALDEVRAGMERLAGARTARDGPLRAAALKPVRTLAQA